MILNPRCFSKPDSPQKSTEYGIHVFGSDSKYTSDNGT